MSVGATSKEPPAVTSPLLPVTVWTASAAPVPSVSLLPLVTVPRDRLTLSVGMLEIPLPSVTPEGVSNVIVWSGLDTVPVPSVSLLLLVTVPRDRVTLSAGMLEIPLPSVTPEGVSNVIVWSGPDTVPVPEEHWVAAAFRNINWLPAVVPVSVPLFVKLVPPVVSVVPVRLSVEPVPLVSFAAVSGNAFWLSVEPFWIVTSSAWLAGEAAKIVAVLTLVVLSTTRAGISPAIWRLEAAAAPPLPI